MHALPHESSAPLGNTRSFLVAFLGLTGLMFADQLRQRLPVLVDRLDLADGATILLLTLPFIIALTLPGAVLVSTAYSFSRPGASRLRPTLFAAVGLSLVAYLVVDQVVPRTNATLRERYIALQAPRGTQRVTGIRGDREMTIAEMQAVVREAEVGMLKAGESADLEMMDAMAARVAQYRVEIEKKRATAAACLVFALTGAGLGLRLAGRRWWIPVGAGAALVAFNYAAVVVGEELGNARTLSPVLAMWGGNLLLGALGVALLWQARRAPRPAPLPTGS